MVKRIRSEQESASLPPIARRRMSRRDFLKVTGVGLAGTSFLGIASCTGGSGGGTGSEFTLTFGPDDTGSLQKAIDRFNEEYSGQYKASYREMPADTGQYFDQLQTELQAGSSEIDLIGADVIWPAQLASQGFIVDLSDRFTEEERGQFLPGPIEALTYNGSVWGVPWRTNTGMLYYRQDLLEENGFNNPPTTWDELKQMARTVQQNSGTQYGLLFQGADYEGGVANALEYIWSAGGEVLDANDPDRVLIDSSGAREGLSIERSTVDDDVAPQSVATFKEPEVQSTFLSGDAVFARHWSVMYGLISNPKESSITTDQVGVAPLPVASTSDQSVSCLGGWNWCINSNSANLEAAWEFIKFHTSAEQQKNGALEGTLLPTRRELYDDQELAEEVPVIPLAREMAENTRPRPVSPYYQDMSLKMAEQFNASLKGDTSPEEATQTLQGQLEQIIEQGQA
jgi:multiple sugar transport system substrate-binding protein